MSVSIIKTIDEEALKFAREFIAQRKAALLSRKANASGDLIASLDYEATKQSIDEAASLLILFDDAGRYIDMKQRSIHYGNTITPIDAIAKWIEEKGFQNFVNGYVQKRGYINPDQAKAIRSMAWGIAINRSKGSFRRKVWFNKAKTAKITELINNIAAKLPQTAGKDIVNQLKKF